MTSFKLSPEKPIKQLFNINYKTTLLFLFTVIVSLICWYLIRDTIVRLDENPHFQSITELWMGQINRETFGRHSSLPGYHLIMGALAWATSLHSFASIRLFNAIFGLLAIVFFYLNAKKLGLTYSYSQTLQFFFLPLSFVFNFLIYTDIMSLAFLLITFYFLQKERFALSAVFALFSTVVRQTNLVWILFFCFYVYHMRHRDKLPLNIKIEHSFRKVADYLWDLRYYLIVFMVIVGIFLSIGNVVVLDQHIQPLLKISLENIYLGLFLFFILFLPLNIANGRRIIQLLKEKPLLLLCLVGFYLIYTETFKMEYFYHFNQSDFVKFPPHGMLLRNWIVNTAAETSLNKLIFFIPIAYSTLSLTVTKLKENVHYLLYPLTILFLSQHWLIDPRYLIIPFTFFLLFKENRGKLVEYSTLALFIIISLSLYYKILLNHIFI